MMKNRIFLIISLLFLLTPLSFAGAMEAWEQAADYMSDAMPYISIVIALNILLITLAYLLGSALEKAEWLVFSKDELFHLFVSVAIIVGIGGFIFISETTTQFFSAAFLSPISSPSSECYSADASLVDVSTCSLQKMKADSMYQLQGYTKESITALMGSSWTWTIYNLFVGSVSTGVDAWKRTYSRTYESLVFMFLAPISVSLSTQSFLIENLYKYAFTYLLPVALLLRVFIPTRHMGNILIVFCLAVYFFLPLLYSFNGIMYESALGSCTDYKDQVESPLFGQCGYGTNVWSIARLIPQAFFLPNLTIAVFITFMSAVDRSLRMIG